MFKPSELDKDLIRYGASFVNLRVQDFHDLTKRSPRALRTRLRKLLIQRRVRFGERKGQEQSGLGLFYSLPNPQNPFEKVFFPTQKCWDRALELGYVKHEVNANREKSDDQLDHDLVLTDLHKALHFAFGDRLHWSQLYKARYHRWGKGQEEYVNADAYFYIELPNGEYASFFVEVENQKGVQEPVRKMRGYLAFANGPYQDAFQHPDFRLIILKPSSEMCLNLLNTTSGDKNIASRKFWITDYNSISRISEKVFHTPKDFEQRLWGFSDLG